MCNTHCFFSKYFIQHCFICLHSDFTVSEDAGIEPTWTILYLHWQSALIKNKIKFSSYIGKFRVEQLQSHIRGRAFLYMRKCENISPYMRRPLVIYDFATAPLWISLYMRKIWFSFLSVRRCNHTARSQLLYVRVRVHTPYKVYIYLYSWPYSGQFG